MKKWLKEKWNIQSNAQFWIIMLVFAITGSTSAKITRPILNSISWVDELPRLAYIIIYLFFTILFYQFLLVLFGWLFGEFTFFWNFEKKIWRRFHSDKKKN